MDIEGFKNFWKNILDFFKSRTFIHIFLFLFVFISLSMLTSYNYFPVKTIKEGEVSPKDILAPSTKKIIDEAATQRSREEAERKAEIIYRQDPLIAQNQEAKIGDLFKIIKEIQLLKQTEDPGNLTKIAELKKDMPFKISASNLKILMEQNTETLNYMESASGGILASAMSNGIKPQDMDKIKKRASVFIKELSVTEELKEIIKEILNNAIISNITLDLEATIRSKQEKISMVEPIKITIKKGQIVLRQGDIVTRRQTEILTAFGFYQESFNLKGILGTSLLILLLILLIIVSLAQQHPKIFFNDKNLVLLSLIIVAASAVTKISVSFSGYLTPIAIASILITVLLDWRLAMLVASILSLQVGIFTGELNTVIVAFAGSMVGIFTSTKINQRWDMVIAGILISIVNILLVISFALFESKDFNTIAYNLLLSGIGGIGSGILALGLLPVFEHLFSITTHIKLLELSNPNEPLLQKLLMEAQGTYQHSITVATLAQNAARIIEADSLLARVGAYYHDIGKIRRPYFFVENQISYENPHDKISPTLSTLIIISHVKDGVDLARNYRLPEVIINFIKESHGTNLVSYFYHQAQSQGEFDKKDFRYQGPKPQSRETAIVMMADAVEATSRTLTAPSPTKIENMVKQIIKDILDDGQLDESELSLKDINNISTTFIHDLTGMYHHRIEYPEKIEQSLKKG